MSATRKPRKPMDAATKALVEGDSPSSSPTRVEHLSATAARLRFEVHKAHGATGTLDSFYCAKCNYSQHRRQLLKGPAARASRFGAGPLALSAVNEEQGLDRQ